MNELLQLLQTDFLLRGFVAGILIAFIAPLIGMYLIVRRYALLADTLAHVSLVGIAVAVILGIHPVAGALAASGIGAVVMEQLRFSKRLSGESALAIFLSGGLALAVILLSLSKNSSINIFSYLFGSITTVSRTDVIILFLATLGVLALVSFVRRQFFFVVFNEELAHVAGLPVRLLNGLLALMTALTVAVALQIVGALLVGALMVLPVVTALQYGYGFTRTQLLAIVFSQLSMTAGLIAAYFFNIPTGATVVVVALLFFLGAVFLNKNNR